MDIEYYRNNPIAYMEEVLGIELLPWQKEMLIAFSKKKSVVMYGGARSNNKLAFRMAIESYQNAMKQHKQ